MMKVKDEIKKTLYSLKCNGYHSKTLNHLRAFDSIIPDCADLYNKVLDCTRRYKCTTILGNYA